MVPQPRHARSWPPTRREVVTAASFVVALAGVGALLALLWVQLAPRLAFRVVQPGRALPVVPEGEEYVAADGRFVLLTLGVGALAGLVGWLLRSSRGPLVLAALAAGGLLGAVVTWRLGLWLEPGYSPQDLQEAGRIVYLPLELGALAALVVEPIAAVLVYLLCAGLQRPPRPGPRRRPQLRLWVTCSSAIGTGSARSRRTIVVSRFSSRSSARSRAAAVPASSSACRSSRVSTALDATR